MRYRRTGFPEPLTQRAVIEWIRRHAPLVTLCQVGGWPDAEHMTIDICDRHANEWTINITTTESIMEISECDVSRYRRCGKFSVTFDAAGQPAGIYLLYPM